MDDCQYLHVHVCTSTLNKISIVVNMWIFFVTLGFKEEIEALSTLSGGNVRYKNIKFYHY